MNTEADYIAHKTAEYLAKVRISLDASREFIEAKVLPKCDSPIERRMFWALAFMEIPAFYTGHEHNRTCPMCPGVSSGDFNEYVYRLQVFPEEGAALFLQQQIDNYRADFLLVVKYAERDELLKMVIECDGHEFHERTKEQAKRDRGRDRAMTAGGYTVFRFTGSEIYRDADRCADEVRRFLERREYETRPK